MENVLDLVKGAVKESGLMEDAKVDSIKVNMVSVYWLRKSDREDTGAIDATVVSDWSLFIANGQRKPSVDAKMLKAVTEVFPSYDDVDEYKSTEELDGKNIYALNDDEEIVIRKEKNGNLYAFVPVGVYYNQDKPGAPVAMTTARNLELVYRIK